MIVAAGILFQAPSGRVLLLKRSDEGDAVGMWGIPGGKLEDGETPDVAAIRETFEETGYEIPDAGTLLMRRVKDGVDFTTFVRQVDDEFTPTLNSEHTAHVWIAPGDIAA